MLIKGKQQSYLDECESLIQAILTGVKAYAIFPKKLNDGNTVFMGSFYHYPIGVYFEEEGKINGLTVYTMNRYQFGSMEESGFAVWTAAKPECREMCRIEVNGELLSNAASLVFLLGLNVRKQIMNQRPQFTLRCWDWK